MCFVPNVYRFNRWQKGSTTACNAQPNHIARHKANEQNTQKMRQNYGTPQLTDFSTIDSHEILYLSVYRLPFKVKNDNDRSIPT